MGNSYCRTPCQLDHDLSHAQTTAHSQCRPTHIKPSEPIKVTGPIQTDDDIQPMITTNRQQLIKAERVSEKRRHLSFAGAPYPKKKKAEQSVEHRFTSALKGLSNSYSTGHLKSCNESQHRHSRHSSTKKVGFKQPITVDLPPNNKLDNFLKKQKEFIEKRKRSIEKIRKLLEIKQDKENPHKPKINAPWTTTARNKKHFGGLVERTVASSAMLERSLNSNDDPKSRISNLNQYLSESVGSSLGTKLREARSELANEEQTRKLLEQLQDAMGKLLIGQDQTISFQLFASLMQSVGMTVQTTQESDSYLTERELLHEAWRMLSHSELLSEDCSQHEVAQFLAALYGYELEEIGNLVRLEQHKFEQVKKRYGLFRTNRDKPPDIVCQDYTQENCSSPMNCQVIDTAPILTRSCHPQQPAAPNRLIKKTINSSNPLKIKKKPTPNRHQVQPLPPSNQVIYETFNTFNPKTAHSKTSENMDMLVSRKTVLEIDVDLGDRTETIKVSHDDDPEKIADCFLKFHCLPGMLQPKLAALVREGLERVNSQH